MLSLALVVLFVSNSAPLSIRRRNAQSPGCGHVEGNLLHSPGYPNNYPSRTHCVYAIPLQHNKALKIKFNDFNMESSVDCSFDYVEVKDNEVSYGKYCGNTLKGDEMVIEDSPFVYIVFHSDESLTKTGFQLEFEHVNKGHDYGGHEVETVTVANTEAFPKPTTRFYPTTPYNPFTQGETSETTPGNFPKNKATPDVFPTHEGTADVFPTHEQTSNVFTTNEGTPDVFPTHEGTHNVHPTHEGTPDVFPTHEGTHNVHPTHEGTPDVFPTHEGTPDVHPTHEGTPDVFTTHEGTPDVFPTHEGTLDVFPTHEGTPDVFPTHEGTPDVFTTHAGTSDAFPTNQGTPDFFPTHEGTSDVFPTPEGTSDVSPTQEGTPDVFPTHEGTSDVFPTNRVTTDVFPTNKVTTDVFPTYEGTSDVFPTNEATPYVFPTNEDERQINPRISNDDSEEEPSSDTNSTANETDAIMSTSASLVNQSFPTQVPMGNESIVSGNATASEVAPTEEVTEGSGELNTMIPTVDPEPTPYRPQPEKNVLDKLKLMALLQRIKFATLQIEELLIGKIVEEEVHESRNTNEAKREMDDFKYGIDSYLGFGRRYKRKVKRDFGTEFIEKIRRKDLEGKKKKRSKQVTEIKSNK